MSSTNPIGPIAVFWQCSSISGMARYDTIAQATDAAEPSSSVPQCNHHPARV